jgi:cell division protein FtsB
LTSREVVVFIDFLARVTVPSWTVTLTFLTSREVVVFIDFLARVTVPSWTVTLTFLTLTLFEFLPPLGYKVNYNNEKLMQSPTPPKQGARASRSSLAASGESSLKRKALSLALFLILAASLLNALFSDRGFLEMLEARQQLLNLEHEIEGIEVRNQHLLEEIRALKSSPLAVERLAREQLGLARPGEVILLIRGQRKD